MFFNDFIYAYALTLESNNNVCMQNNILDMVIGFVSKYK